MPKTLYVIGSFTKGGVQGNDSGDLTSYLELGWELLTTGMKIKQNIEDYRSADTYFTTTRDRLFMYKHLSDNLIAWEDINLDDFDNKIYLHNPNTFLEDLRYYSDIEWTDSFKSRFKEIDIDESEDENYICFQVRRRDHAAWRNGPTGHLISLIHNLSKKYKVFVVGKGNEDLQSVVNCELVNLEKYTSLLRSKGCLASFGISSGCSMLNYIYGREGLPVHILYTEDRRMIDQNRIMFFGEKLNVANVNNVVHFDFPSYVRSIENYI